MTITKSMTISCPYTEGGALAGGNGIIVNCRPRPTSSSSAASTSSASTRRATASASSPGLAPHRGHRHPALQRREQLRHLASSRAASATSTSSTSTVAQNGNGATGGGILIQPTGRRRRSRRDRQRSRVQNNANHGLSVDTTGNTGRRHRGDGENSAVRRHQSATASSRFAPAAVRLDHVDGVGLADRQQQRHRHRRQRLHGPDPGEHLDHYRQLVHGRHRGS